MTAGAAVSRRRRSWLIWVASMPAVQNEGKSRRTAGMPGSSGEPSSPAVPSILAPLSRPAFAVPDEQTRDVKRERQEAKDEDRYPPGKAECLTIVQGELPGQEPVGCPIVLRPPHLCDFARFCIDGDDVQTA